MMKIFTGIDKNLYPDLIWKYLAFCRKRAYIKLIDCLIFFFFFFFKYSSLTFMVYASGGATSLT